MDTFSKAPKCPCCNEDGTITCTTCEDVKYCSLECQMADLPAHQHLCKTFKAFQQRPSCEYEHAFRSVWAEGQPDMVRAVYFPVDEEKPRWVWIPASLCNDENEGKLKPYLAKAAGDKLKLNKAFGVVVDCVARKNFKNRVDVLINHVYNFDGSSINQSILRFTSWRLGFPWSAPVLVYAARGRWNREDMDMEDVTALTHFMIDYDNEKPEYLAGKRRKGRKVEGVKIRCDRETKRNGGKKFVAVKVPPSSLLFHLGDHAIHASKLAASLGMSIVSAQYSCLPSEAGDHSSVALSNHQAALMHRNIDRSAAPADLQFDIPGQCGIPHEYWLSGAGDVLVVRADRQPLKLYVVEALCSYIGKELGPLFQCLRAGEYYEGLPVTREQVLAQITPRKWEMYLQEWEDKNAIQDDESDEEDSDSDGEGDSFRGSIL
ncbi:hypothetical protein LTR85_007894 [Meristemomyces frigidus]|nr:hypothetical protein LTR85_007894 [Meristemomyces frigidus]